MRRLLAIPCCRRGGRGGGGRVGENWCRRLDTWCLPCVTKALESVVGTVLSTSAAEYRATGKAEVKGLEVPAPSSPLVVRVNRTAGGRIFEAPGTKSFDLPQGEPAAASSGVVRHQLSHFFSFIFSFLFDSSLQTEGIDCWDIVAIFLMHRRMHRLRNPASFFFPAGCCGGQLFHGCTYSALPFRQGLCDQSCWKHF